MKLIHLFHNQGTLSFHILPRYTPVSQMVEPLPETVLKFTDQQFREIAQQINYGY